MVPCPPSPGRCSAGRGRRPAGPPGGRGGRAYFSLGQNKNIMKDGGGWDFYFYLRGKKKKKEKAPALGVAVTARIKLENWLIK